jgi:hypothetical protein
MFKVPTFNVQGWNSGTRCLNKARNSIEFDHQRPANLRRSASNVNQPTRPHIHTVVRAPNGNDCDKDLLRQHYGSGMDSSNRSSRSKRFGHECAVYESLIIPA